LKAKLEKLTASQIFFLQEEISRYWHVEKAYGAPHPDAEKFLETLGAVK
jgi:hypothetical protein